MGDVFRRRCGCGAITRLRESCPACAERRRAELRARPDARLVGGNRIDHDLDLNAHEVVVWDAVNVARSIAAPSRWAAEAAERRAHERDLDKSTFDTVEPAQPRYVTPDEVREGDVVRARSAFSIGVYGGVVHQTARGLAAFKNGFADIFIKDARDIEILERKG